MKIFGNREEERKFLSELEKKVSKKIKILLRDGYSFRSAIAFDLTRDSSIEDISDRCIKEVKVDIQKHKLEVSELDWLSSPFITFLAIVSSISWISFVR